MAVNGGNALLGQTPDANKKCYCDRCKKKMLDINFYTYRDGSKSQLCKDCLTARVDNFDPSTFMWILQKMDVPYIESEWNILRDKAFNKDPLKMTGLSVIGKYLAKMKLKQFKNYTYADSEKLNISYRKKVTESKQQQKKEKEQYEAQLKEKLEKGQITKAEYETLVSTETLHENFEKNRCGNVVTGTYGLNPYNHPAGTAPSSYQQALQYARNPFQEQNFIPQEQIDIGGDLTNQDKVYLAVKWGRLYTPAQWVFLEKLYNEFMNSFDIQGAARIDTLKMICKTSLKMNEAIDSGDIDAYQKLSRVYDALMKSAKFTEAQNGDKQSDAIDSVSAIVDFAESKGGCIPRYKCLEPEDLVDKILLDLKQYTKSLIYEDKSLAQEIEKYLKNKEIAEQKKRDKESAKEHGLDDVELTEEDYIEYVETLEKMREHDRNLTDQQMEEEYKERRIYHDGTQ